MAHNVSGPRSNVQDSAPSSSTSTSTSASATPLAQMNEGMKRAADWNRLPQDERSRAQAFFEKLAEGLASPAGTPIAQKVFNDLIAHEAYGLFGDAFKAYHRHRDGAASLALCLPPDWRCTAPAARDEAFGLISLQRLTVERPHAQPLEQKLPLTGSVSKAQKERWAAPVSADACDAVVALLKKNSVQELSIQAALASPQPVADALAGNPLTSITLGSTSTSDAGLGAEEKEGYKTLMASLKTCATLQNLVFGHAELVGLHEEILGLQSRGGPALVSVKLMGDALELGASDTVPTASFVQAVKACGSLTELTLHAFAPDSARLSNMLLKPLQFHEALTKLEIIRSGSRQLCTPAAYKKALLEVAEFSQNSSSLTHFTWAAGTLAMMAGPHMEQQRAMGADVLMQHDENKLANALKPQEARVASISRAPPPAAPRFKLKALTMTGFPLPPGFVRKLFESLAHRNSPIEHLDLSGGFMCLNEVLRLEELLRTNTTLRTLRLPENPTAYYFQGCDGRIHGIQLVPLQGPTGSHHGTSLRLVVAKGTPAGDQGRVEEEFKELAARAELLIRSPQALLDRRRRASLLESSFPALQQNVANFLNAKELGLELSNALAQKVVTHLAGDHATSSIVRLSEVNKVAAGQGSQPDAPMPQTRKTREALQQLVRGDNRALELRKPPKTSVNKVNAQGANEKLLTAARANNVEELKKLRQQDDALDFGDHALNAAPSFKALDALMAPVQTSVTNSTASKAKLTTTSAVDPNTFESIPRPPLGE